ncbi:hypothetical protein GCM10023153_16600 [Ornithinibacter aureus]|uniref:DUF6318 domain-containing protein n=2 Tax=Ornithinibacter aureus TaxID=622664 RepID=A0ABP8JRN2_9MICO|nr:hypothetical protein C8E84_2198 [Ornithinibacter aureus]
MPFAATVAALALVVAGCSQPEPAPPTTAPPATSAAPSPTTTPTPTQTGPDIPAAARTQDEKGGIAFVKFFIDQVNESYTTPRDDLIPALSDPECISCADSQSKAKQFVASKSRAVAPPYTPSKLTWVGEQATGVFIVTMTLRQAETEIRLLSGKAAGTIPEAKDDYRVGITWKGDQWIIVGLAGA